MHLLSLLVGFGGSFGVWVTEEMPSSLLEMWAISGLSGHQSHLSTAMGDTARLSAVRYCEGVRPPPHTPSLDIGDVWGCPPLRLLGQCTAPGAHHYLPLSMILPARAKVPDVPQSKHPPICPLDLNLRLSRTQATYKLRKTGVPSRVPPSLGHRSSTWWAPALHRKPSVPGSSSVSLFRVELE